VTSKNFYLESIISKLKDLGFRSSKIRNSILEILYEANKPLNALEILELFSQKNLAPNKTSVYRELDILCMNGALLQVNLGDGKVRYELGDDSQHIHLACVLCSEVMCFDLGKKFDTIKKQVALESGFEIQRSSIELFGTCQKCKMN
jgi:Fur family ferric uptake transcriptional regulator